MLTIYHNPRCSKSRQTLELIQQNSNKEITIVEYLKQPLSQKEITQLLSQLGCKPVEMMRVKEAEFKEQALSDANDEQLIQAMVSTPKLIERPIVTDGKSAIIGRPPENVLTLC
ncbi:MAG: arsenate reductase (glutaredoxin) [Colwellia sp.]|nr:arsenate reductase (glutaredoxin) [Colwellia sp.]MCW9081388.1 arsenate reductase (glutaredoxin) [Colwellia sp.]